MRQLLPIAVFAVALLLAAPAQAQLRANLPTAPAPVVVYDQPTGTSLLSRYVNSETFKLSHSYEFSYSNLGSEGVGLGVYTTSLRWQPSERLAARVDVGVAHSPFGSSALQQRMGFDQGTPAQVYLRNAAVAYRPSENTLITLSVQQSPYGSFYSPYGHQGMYGMSPFGGSQFRTMIAPADHDAFFWRNPSR
jgi:hypothetical protein